MGRDPLLRGTQGDERGSGAGGPLARSLGGAPALKELVVGRNDIGEAAKAELKAAGDKGGVKIWM